MGGGISSWNELDKNNSLISRIFAAEALSPYRYCSLDQSPVNVDFESGLVAMTKYTARDKGQVPPRGEASVMITDPTKLEPFINIMGLLALPKEEVGRLPEYAKAIATAIKHVRPSY